MRILMVNWARMADGPSRGGGANGYLRELAIELARRGHEVSSVSSGMAYVPRTWIGTEPDGSRLPGACEIRRMRDFRVDGLGSERGEEGAGGGVPPAIRVFEAINSPVVAPSLFQFRAPRGEMGCPEIEAEFSRLLGVVRPEVVHFHNIEGLSPMCVDACRLAVGERTGARVVFSLHNYQTICPQVYLMRGGVEACFDSENGHACERCIDAPVREAEIGARLEGYWRERPELVRRGREIVGAPAPSVWSRVFGCGRGVPSGPPMPGVAMDAIDASHAEPADLGVAPRGETGGGERSAPEPRGHGSQPAAREVFVPLVNSVRAEGRSMLPPNDYALRRRAMVDMLNRCDRVLAVSSFVERKFASMGVQRERMRTLHIGTRMSELAPGRHAPSVRGEPGVLRLAFVGYHNWYKGLHVLIAALELMPGPARARIDLAVHAKDVGTIAARLEGLRSGLRALRVSAEYAFEELPAVLRDRDAGVVPSVWWDNGPQTVLEYLACGVPVIGAEVGGIPDVIRDGTNGLLFRANDPADLARVIARLLEDESLCARLRAGVSPPKSMHEHAAEIEAEYQALLGSGSTVHR